MTETSPSDEMLERLASLFGPVTYEPSAPETEPLRCECGGPLVCRDCGKAAEDPEYRRPHAQDCQCRDCRHSREWEIQQAKMVECQPKTLKWRLFRDVRPISAWGIGGSFAQHLPHPVKEIDP